MNCFNASSVVTTHAHRGVESVNWQDDVVISPKFLDLYDLGEGQLVEGSAAEIREARRKDSNQNDNQEVYVVKIIKRHTFVRDKRNMRILNEITILKQMNHKNIVKCFDFYDEIDSVYLLMEKITGGTLLQRISEMNICVEADLRRYSTMLMEAVGYCHEHKVAHRNLKPENFLLASEGEDFSIKIADFGLAKKCRSEDCLYTRCGTPHYVAPEILFGHPYGTQADMWSLGVNIYILISGNYPFFHGTSERNEDKLMEVIKEGSFEFQLESWHLISREAKNLITKLLVVDPKNRLTAREALHSSWFHMTEEDLDCKHLSLNQQKIKKFYAIMKVKAAVHTLMATQAFRDKLSKIESDDVDKNSSVVLLKDVQEIENSDFSLNL